MMFQTKKAIREERDTAYKLGAQYKTRAEALDWKVQEQAARIEILENDLTVARAAVKEEKEWQAVAREEYRQLVLACMAVVRTTDARVRNTRQGLENMGETVEVIAETLREVCRELGDLAIRPEIREVEDL